MNKEEKQLYEHLKKMSFKDHLLQIFKYASKGADFEEVAMLLHSAIGYYENNDDIIQLLIVLELLHTRFNMNINKMITQLFIMSKNKDYFETTKERFSMKMNKQS